MKKQIIFFTIVCVLVLSMSGLVFADDYQPLPGLLGPDEVDFGGKTVTIIRGGIPGPERVEEAEKLFNVKIEQLRIDTPEQMISRIMAGDSINDIIRMPHRQGYFNLVNAGMLLPVGDILPAEHYEALPAADRYTIEKLEYRGSYYGFGVYHGFHNGSMWFMFYNKDILKRYDLPDPYELWLNDEWTYDAMEEIMKVVTADTDGDGVIDQFGITPIAGSADVFRFSPSNGVELARIDDNGKYIFDYDSEAGIEVLNRIHRWAFELNLMGGQFSEDQNVVFSVGNLAGIRHSKAAGIDYGIVSLPKGPHADKYSYPVFEYWMNMLAVNAEYPEGLMALAGFLYREEDTYDDVDFRINEYMTNRDHEHLYMTAIADWAGEGDMFQGKIVDLWGIVKPGVEEATNGLKGAAAAMDEVRPKAQAFLDDLFDQ